MFVNLHISSIQIVWRLTFQFCMACKNPSKSKRAPFADPATTAAAIGFSRTWDDFGIQVLIRGRPSGFGFRMLNGFGV